MDFKNAFNPHLQKTKKEDGDRFFCFSFCFRVEVKAGLIA